MPARGRTVLVRPAVTLVARLLVVLPVLLPVLLAWAARARAAAPDVIVYGDPTLAHALRDVGARFTSQTGVPVHVFAAPPALILAQLRHQVWNDVLVTLEPWMDQAEQAGVIEPGTRTGAWRNTLVIARASGVTPANDTIAVTDPEGGDIGVQRAFLVTQGLYPKHVQGVANTSEVAFLLDTGAAAQGLLYLTDVRADPKLRVVAPVTAPALQPLAPIVYAAAISTLTHSPNAHAFLDYLRSPAATEVLRADGLETVPAGMTPPGTSP